ncbi:hypothetical protein Metev_0613 [Methanohalobium evestigatum Z-7303]|uniref:Uncharacterized protein n=1 Tax=Methanohalobium evestigatum (strain ATCC BAA-1072 / DSM 3721 / NBRC 107634 / OCM 161 / Z-7303) TaxID=644295 RepID=D7E8H7_METEZ|nr:hypothetical protein [Methanohalobium evestigatum]ADI73519.1 hypothetical protein Metev_0613 [Methanohalobium evestigatum Z-7303]
MKMPNPSVTMFVVLFFLAAAFGTPESSKHLVEGLNVISNGVLEIPPTIEVPVIGQYLLLIIGFVTLVNGLDLHFKENYSPKILGSGFEHPYAYNGDYMVHSGFCMAGAEGCASPVPRPGTHIIIAPGTHVHRIAGNHLIVTANVMENTPLDETPVELKQKLRSMKGMVFGPKSSAIGFLSTRELEKYKKFEVTNPNTNKKEYVNVNTFIQEELMGFNKSYDVIFQVANNETKGVSKFLGMITSIGKESARNRNDGFLKRHLLR